MYNPATVFTKDGLDKYNAHLVNLGQALFYITNNADDLHLGNSDEGDKVLQLMWQLQEVLEGNLLWNGDNETLDDDS